MRIVINISLALVFLLTGCHVLAQPNTQAHAANMGYLDSSYLNSFHLSPGLIISDYSIEEDNHLGIADLTKDGNHLVSESSPYYFQFNPAHCAVDPFASKEDTRVARDSLRTCLQQQIWESEKIPYWMKATGAAMVVGIATGSGKEDLSIRIGLDEVDSMLRQWFSSPNK